MNEYSTDYAIRRRRSLKLPYNRNNDTMEKYRPPSHCGVVDFYAHRRLSRSRCNGYLCAEGGYSQALQTRRATVRLGLEYLHTRSYLAIGMRMIKVHYAVASSISTQIKIAYNLQIQKRSLPLYWLFERLVNHSKTKQ